MPRKTDRVVGPNVEQMSTVQIVTAQIVTEPNALGRNHASGLQERSERNDQKWTGPSANPAYIRNDRYRHERTQTKLITRTSWMIRKPLPSSIVISRLGKIPCSQSSRPILLTTAVTTIEVGHLADDLAVVAVDK